jgi:hypothetical protein
LASRGRSRILALVKRVPIPLVIPLAAGAIALPWWLGTRDMDFLKPPGDFELARIRSDVASSFPKRVPDVPAIHDSEQNRAFQSPIKPPPVIDPGNAHAPAELDAYREHAKVGAAGFIELAAHLEEQSGNARALLAWERVLDVCQPDPSQRAAAVAGVRRLQPLVAPWHVDPREATLLVLETVVPEGVAAGALEGVLADCANVLGKHSAGLLRFESRVDRPVAKPAPRPPKKPKNPKKPVEPEVPPAPPAPVTMSLQILRDGGDASVSTGLIEIPLADDPDQLRREILAGAYKLVASQLAAATDFTPPEPLAPADDPAAALQTRITRLCWSEFGKSFHGVDPP